MDLHILCVDDVRSNVILLKKILEKHEGYRVETCLSGEEAKHHIEQHQVDVVVTDQEMPEVSGIDLIKWIQEFQPQIETMVVTAHSSLQLAVEAIKAGATDYIEKPVDAPLLMEKIDGIHRKLMESNQYEEREEGLTAEKDEAMKNMIELQLTVSKYQKGFQDIENLLSEHTFSSTDDLKQMLNQLLNTLQK